MAYGAITLPLTGAGDATAQPAVDVIGGMAYQAMKLVDGLEGSTDPVRALATTPAGAERALLTRNIASTAFNQAVVGAVELTSAGSTKLAGRVTVENPSTAVTVTSGVVLGAGSSANTLGAVAQGAGSTTVAPWYVISTASAGAGSTTVDANLTSAGSTKLAGRMTVDNPTTAVTVTSGVVLGAGSSANTLGAVAQGAGSTTVTPWYVISTASAGAGSTTVDANLTSAGSTKLVGQVSVTSGVVLGAGSSANVLGAVAQGAGSTTVAPWYVISTASAGAGSTTVDANLTSAGSTKLVGQVSVTSGVILGAGSSANTLGAVAQGPGSSDSVWSINGYAFSSGQVTRSSVATSVDVQVVAAGATRKALIIANRSTLQTVGLGFSTAAVTTALANVDFFLAPSAHVAFGIAGSLPLYLGPIRAINLTSTAVAGSVGVVSFA